MLKKEKMKLILTLILTPTIIIVMVGIAILTRQKPILKREYTDTHTQRELLDVIDHTHTVQVQK